MISFFLNSQGISCHVLNDAKDVLYKIKNEEYNAMLLNLAMPEFSGYNTLIIFKKEDLLNGMMYNFLRHIYQGIKYKKWLQMVQKELLERLCQLIP